MSISQIFPNTPHGDEARYSIFDEEERVETSHTFGSLAVLTALVAAGNPVVKSAGSVDAGMSLSQLQSLVNDEPSVATGIFPMGALFDESRPPVNAWFFW
jgi:hypothetical protein